MFNSSQETHNLPVSVENDSGKTLFQEMYRLKAEKADEAAKSADVSLCEWLEIAHERKLELRLSPDDFQRDADTALDL